MCHESASRGRCDDRSMARADECLDVRAPLLFNFQVLIEPADDFAGDIGPLRMFRCLRGEAVTTSHYTYKFHSRTRLFECALHHLGLRERDRLSLSPCNRRTGASSRVACETGDAWRIIRASAEPAGYARSIRMPKKEPTADVPWPVVRCAKSEVGAIAITVYFCTLSVYQI